MIKVPKKVHDRIIKALRKYQGILVSAKDRDVNEADTVKIVAGILTDVLGWDRWDEITSEYKVRSQYVDLATKAENIVHFLIEVKAIGLDLKEWHLKQVVHYAADLGTEWVILTSGHTWEAHKVLFEKPIKHQKVFSLNLMEVNPMDKSVIEKLFLISREGITKSAISTYQRERKAANRFSVAAVLQTEPLLKAMRRELKRANTDAKIDLEDLRKKLTLDVLKRDVVDSEETKKALRKIQRAQK